MTPGRATLALAASGSLVAVLLALGAGAGAQESAEEENPCLARGASQLRCPDLRMARPTDVWADRHTRRGRVLLRSRNSIDSVGLGPASLRGRRDGRKTMRAYQVIQRKNGRRKLVDTGARLYFQPIPRQYRYWKFADAARFELWSLDRKLRKKKLVRVGPKQNYCLRDLTRTRPSRRSPRRRVYPACSQDRDRRSVTLGTSVGWSDIYPATYHQNWIDVTGLPRGRYLYVHIADPKNGIWELDETNNEAEVMVSLPSGRALGSRRSRGGSRERDPYG